MPRVGHDRTLRERTDDVCPDEIGATFESMMLSPSILRGLKDTGFVAPSPIQLRAIPLGRCGLGSCLHVIFYMINSAWK